MTQPPRPGIPLQYQRRTTSSQVVEVASYTRKVITVFLAAIVIGCAGGGIVGALEVSAGGTNAAPPPYVGIIELVVNVISIVLSILMIVYCWKLNQAVGWSGARALWLIVPLAGLIYLVMVIMRGCKVCKEAGMKIGLLGPKE